MQANPGQLSHNDLMLLYKKHVDPSASWECATQEELANARINAPLSMEKLFKVYPEARERVLPVKEAMEAMMIRAAQNESAKRQKV